MNQSLNRYSVQLTRHRFDLFPTGGLHWPAQDALLVADLHLGKDSTFRAAGIGVPRGSTRATLAAVSRIIEESRSRRVYILGDLCHSRTSLSADTKERFMEFRMRHDDVEMILIEGNHDRSTGRLPAEWRLHLIEGIHEIDGVAMTHIPEACPPNCDLLIAGHIHPAYTLVCGNETTGKLPCFWYSERCLILPACGHFTGTARIKPKVSDRLWLVADDQIIPVM